MGFFHTVLYVSVDKISTDIPSAVTELLVLSDSHDHSRL